jgi:hypothetical protein
VPHDASGLALLLSRAWLLRLGCPPGRAGAPPARAGVPACRLGAAALLVALVVLVTGLGAPVLASAHDSHPGYSAADDRNADVAVFELDPGAVPGLPGAPFFDLPCRFRGLISRDPGATRASLPTRDRSPPAR